MKIPYILSLALSFIAPLFASAQSLSTDKSGFTEIRQVIPDIVYDIRYHGSDNFVGTRVEGYRAEKAFLSTKAAQALKKVQAELKKQGLGLKVFDAYRPQKAVDHFVRWGRDLADTLTKSKYYPEIDKAHIFELGYVATKSGHSRGSTIDLSIINLNTQEEVDMGSPWDFFGIISHHDSALISSEQAANRDKLRRLMIQFGFRPYSNEWWHYTLIDEPFPNTYFDFDNQ